MILIMSSCISTADRSEGNVPTDESRSLSSKLFLLSKGLTTDTLKKEFLDLLEKDPQLHSVAVVVNATTTEKKKFKKTKKVKVQFEQIGFDSTKIDLFDLMKRSPEDLYSYDIIYILGGNPFQLLDEVNRSGADTVLINLASQDKILMGYSAGSLLLGPDLTLMNYVDSLLEFNQLGLKELSCAELYNFYIFPHYEDFSNQVPELRTKIKEFESMTEVPVYRLNDNQGIICINGEVQIIGK